MESQSSSDLWIWIIAVIGFVLVGLWLIARSEKADQPQQNKLQERGGSPPPQFWPWPWNGLMVSEPVKRLRAAIFPDEMNETSDAIFGGSRMGKTSHLVGQMVIAVIRRVAGAIDGSWVFFDPHGDASQEVFDRLALLYRKFPKQLERLICYIDLTDENITIGFNPYAGHGHPMRRAKKFTDAVLAIFHDDPTEANRLYRVLYKASLTLIYVNRPMTDIPKLLTDEGYRTTLLLGISDEELKQYWKRQFPHDYRRALELTESTLNRIERILSDPVVAKMLSAPVTFDPEEIVRRGVFVIIRAPKWEIGDDAAYFALGMFLTALYQAAGARPKGQRNQIIFYCDEVVNYLVPACASIPSEGAKMGLKAVFCTQNVKSHIQDEVMLASILNSCQNIITFRLGYHEAESLVREIMLPDLDQVKYVERKFHFSGGIPTVDEHITFRSVEEIYLRATREIQLLPKRTMLWYTKGTTTTRRVTTVTLHNLERIANEQTLQAAKSELRAAVKCWYASPDKPHQRGVDDFRRLLPGDVPDEDYS